MKDRTSRPVEAPSAVPVPATDEYPSVDPIRMTAVTEMNRMNEPMLKITAPGINIASLPSPVDMDPMMRSGNPMMNKVMPTPIALPALLLEDEGALDLNPILRRPIRLTTKINPPMPMKTALGMSSPKISLFSSF